MAVGVILDAGTGICHRSQLLPAEIQRVVVSDIAGRNENRKWPVALFQAWVSLGVDTLVGVIECDRDNLLCRISVGRHGSLNQVLEWQDAVTFLFNYIEMTLELIGFDAGNRRCGRINMMVEQYDACLAGGARQYQPGCDNCTEIQSR